MLQEWADPVKYLKKPKLDKLFEWKELVLVEDRWGKKIDSPMMDKNGNPLNNKEGNKIFTQVIVTLDDTQNPAINT